MPKIPPGQVSKYETNSTGRAVVTATPTPRRPTHGEPGSARAPPQGAFSCTIENACRLSGISRSILYEVIAAEKIAAFKLGRRTLVSIRSLEDYIASLTPMVSNPAKTPARKRQASSTSEPTGA